MSTVVKARGMVGSPRGRLAQDRAWGCARIRKGLMRVWWCDYGALGTKRRFSKEGERAALADAVDRPGRMRATTGLGKRRASVTSSTAGLMKQRLRKPDHG